MVDMLKNFKFKKPNAKQKTYAATLFAVTGGTTMYTAWQFIIPTELEMPEIALILKITLMLGSLIFVAIGYNIYTEENK